MFLINFFNNFKKLKYLAYHDLLTGLLNRNWFYENINMFFNFKYVYFIDINDLHKVNESGHTFGDEHIREIVKFIKNKLKSDEIFIRYSGDEFIIFSNRENFICTDRKVSIGLYRINEDIISSIHNADINMIENKNILKNKK